MPATAQRYREVLQRVQYADHAALARGEPARRPLTDAEIDLMVERYAAKQGQWYVKVGPSPIGPRSADERVYERAIRRVVLAPLMRQLRSGLSRAAAASQLIAVLNGVDWTLPEGLVAEEVAAQSARLSGYHRRRLIQAFRSALRVDIRPMLNEAAIEPLMSAWRRQNISLIRTIPQRMHDGLYRRMTRTFMDRPFDQQALSKVLNEEFRVSAGNLRRITRDQTSKAIGQLTRSRHQQIGIQEYIWRTAQDERVRDSHVSLDGTRQRWDTPPSVGHPGEDIQCRCVSIPVIAALDDGKRYPPRVEPSLEVTDRGETHSTALLRDSPSVEGLTSESFARRTTADYRAQKYAQHRKHPQLRGYDSLPLGVREYRGSSYGRINQRLRERLPLDARDQRILLDVERSVIPLVNRQVLYRGIRGRLNWKPGAAEMLRAPTSTSMDIARGFGYSAGDTLFELHPSSGVRALVYNGVEAEVLFAIGQKIDIIAVHHNIEIGKLGKVKRYVVGRIRL